VCLCIRTEIWTCIFEYVHMYMYVCTFEYARAHAQILKWMFGTPPDVKCVRISLKYGHVYLKLYVCTFILMYVRMNIHVHT